MKLLVVLCFLTFASLSSAKPDGYPRGCLYVLEKCYSEYEEGTHSYTPGCTEKTPEPTCEVPNPQKEKGKICDYSACYCDSPTVRDTTTGKCVTLDQCTKQ